MSQIRPTLTIGIPSYGRPQDLNFLLQSIASSTTYPDEIVILEDASPDAERVSQIAEIWRDKFESLSIKIFFQINPINLGYDKNLKELLRLSSSDFVTFIGNDDIFTVNGIEILKKFISKNPKINAFSRTFTRFNQLNGVLHEIGVSRFAKEDTVFTPANALPAIYFRISAYFGGLTYARKWALSHEVNFFDGTLYYQVYLSGMAFYDGGIGYVGKPVVGGRTDGVPLFGSAESEKSVHSPGGYSPKARASMWSNILRISQFIDMTFNSNSEVSVHKEIMVRMSFHVFEGYATKSTGDLFALVGELWKIKMFQHPVPIILFVIVFVLRGKSTYVFKLIRWIYQR